MARIINLVRDEKNRYSQHQPTDCRFYIFNDTDGNKILQLDTYGTTEREFPGKTSQSIQFSPEAIQQLKVILAEQFDH